MNESSKVPDDDGVAPKLSGTDLLHVAYILPRLDDLADLEADRATTDDGMTQPACSAIYVSLTLFTFLWGKK